MMSKGVVKMKKYIAPEADIYNYRLTEDILDVSAEYDGDEIINEEIVDPFA